MLLKALLSFNVGLSVGRRAPADQVSGRGAELFAPGRRGGERLAGMVAVEIDKRVKEALTGDVSTSWGTSRSAR